MTVGGEEVIVSLLGEKISGWRNSWMGWRERRRTGVGCLILGGRGARGGVRGV